VRSLLISDLHIGSRLEHDVLRHPAALDRLLAALDEVDRLVLLGDVIELMEGRAQHAMSVAEPVMRAIGRRLGADKQVIVVPGNHDAPLVGAWIRRRGEELQVDTEVDPAASPALATLVSWLTPARVSVRYPGVWLSERVWATHGHYLDQHLLPQSPIGMARGLLRRMPRDEARPIDYERVRRPSLTRFARWFPRPLAALLDDLAEVVRAVSAPRAPRRLLHRRAAPLNAMLLGAQVRRAAVPAVARVAHRLRIDTDWVLFGHIHRLGPLPADDPLRWQGRGGRPRIANTGSWLYEPLLIHDAAPPHPYWPGGALLLEDGEDPRPIGLLDDLDASELR
jgi:hypothetical protein